MSGLVNYPWLRLVGLRVNAVVPRIELVDISFSRDARSPYSISDGNLELFVHRIYIQSPSL